MLMSLQIVSFFEFLGRGFGGNDFFVGEVSFENVVPVKGFTYVS